MTTAVQQLLNAFDNLPETDKHEAVAEILRRVSASVEGDVPESALNELAAELFRSYDAEEDARAAP
ncbi:MAG TPA: CRISPR-associated endonuclease Cas2 [Gemmataceae bacterium]|nr:CRISPR-associated endonuclease Cas2 [Gemmataceae bacterium]